MNLNKELIDVDDSVLLVIDVQDRFLEKYSETDQEILKNRIGLERMRRAGVVISSVKSLFYEWVRTVQRCGTFMKKYKKEIGMPQGIVM